MVKEFLINTLSNVTLGPSITASMRLGYEKITLQKYLKCRSRIKRIKIESKKPAVNRDGAPDFDNKQIVQVNAPLALISQIQRSGGSLLSQLFDGHPQLHAHPHELKMGYPKKYYWPELDLSDTPERWFFLLFEDIVITHSKEGFKKSDKSDYTHPFQFMPSKQKKIFLHYVESKFPLQLRDVFDAYMTSYFNAWMDNNNLTNGPKKFITAFTPRMAMFKKNMDHFKKIYPDGKLISIVRDPKNWFPSAFHHRKKDYGDLSNAIDLWKENANAMIRNKEVFGENFCIIRFEDLIAKMESAMRYLSRFLNIEYNDILLAPTFNGSPISANTSFKLEKSKIIKSTLSRYKTLDSERLKAIDSMTSDLYKIVLDKTVNF